MLYSLVLVPTYLAAENIYLGKKWHFFVGKNLPESDPEPQIETVLHVLSWETNDIAFCFFIKKYWAFLPNNMRFVHTHDFQGKRSQTGAIIKHLFIVVFNVHAELKKKCQLYL